MKKSFVFILIGVSMLFCACNDSTYSSLRNQEDKLIDNYISRNHIRVLKEEPAPGYQWSENDYYEVSGYDRLYFHLVHRGDSVVVDSVSPTRKDTIDQTISINDVIVTRYKKFALTENADTASYWTTSEAPFPYEFYYGITSGTSNGRVEICEATGWHIAVQLMKYPESECIIIVPSKQGFDADETSVTPYGYRLKIKVKR